MLHLGQFQPCPIINGDTTLGGIPTTQQKEPGLSEVILFYWLYTVHGRTFTQYKFEPQNGR